MGSHILIVNIGSASKKYAIYDGMDEVLFCHFEKGDKENLISIRTSEKFEKNSISADDYNNSLEFLNNYAFENLKIGIDDIYAVSFRVVSPGSFFLDNQEIDEEYLEKLKQAENYDEIHIRPVYDEIIHARKIFKEQKFIGISDSAFHKTKLEESKYYGISKKIQDENDYKRFGYHGISMQSVAEKIRDNEKEMLKKVVVCHLGSGISITALMNGKSLDNTMGFSPLEGPVMSTRSGSVDPVLIFDLFNGEKKNEKIEFLFEESGLLGLSGVSGDLRIIKQEVFKGNQNAKFALKVYIFNILKKIAEMVSVLKGIDAIVFTGTIGFRSGFTRELILEDLRWLGLDFDLEKNANFDMSSDYFCIQSFDSKIKIIVCETDEMKEMSKITLKIM
jgi:acetate kinase